MNPKRMIAAWLRAYYLDKLEEIKQNRLYLIAEASATHKMLDEQEQKYLAKADQYKEV